MKHLITTAALTILFLQVDAQHTTPFGLPDNFTEVKSTPPIEPEIQEMNRSAVGLSCTNNTFWSSTASGQVLEFQLNGNTVNSVGVVVSSLPPNFYTSLGIANNLLGGSYSPTFYCSSNTGVNYLYDGSSWAVLPGTSTCTDYNAAGMDNAIYFQYNGSIPTCIEKFTGTSYANIYTNNVSYFSVADLAVDDFGNIWTLQGTITSMSSNVVVISPSGTVIKQYPFVLNTNNAYGCFLLNGIMYIGLGANNPISPNTLVPISFTADTAIAGTPIAMGVTALGDLASCSPGAPLSIEELNAQPGNFQIEGTMVSTTLGITLNESNAEIALYDLNGGCVFRKSFQNRKQDLIEIDISSLAGGIYIVSSGNTSRKFLKVQP